MDRLASVMSRLLIINQQYCNELQDIANAMDPTNMEQNEVLIHIIYCRDMLNEIKAAIQHASALQNLRIQAQNNHPNWNPPTVAGAEGSLAVTKRKRTPDIPQPTKPNQVIHLIDSGSAPVTKILTIPNNGHLPQLLYVNITDVRYEVCDATQM